MREDVEFDARPTTRTVGAYAANTHPDHPVLRE